MAKGICSNNEMENGATLSIMASLWAAADTHRRKMDAAEYKQVILGLTFLKYIERKSTQKTLR
jgi:type I restriction-modification system DNA methylase subunit